jgi:hypothetical protein
MNFWIAHDYLTQEGLTRENINFNNGVNLNSSCIKDIKNHPNYLKIYFLLNSNCGTISEWVSVGKNSEKKYTNMLKLSGSNVNYINAKPVKFSCNYPTQYKIHSVSIQKTPNVCSCDFGNAATGTNCEIDGSAKCTFCNTGYGLYNNACILVPMTYPNNCYQDNGSDRDLPQVFYIPSGLPDSIAWCRSKCGDVGYIYAGVQCRVIPGLNTPETPETLHPSGFEIETPVITLVQWNYECFCGNSFGKHGRMPNGDCSFSCQDTSGINKCGGSSRNNVYLSTGLI